MSILFFVLLLRLALASNVTVEERDENSQTYLKLASGNSLWTALITNCTKPTMECVRKNVYTYLEDTLDYPSDLQVTPFVKFTKNQVDYERIASGFSDSDERADDEARAGLEEVSRSLQGKGVKFMMTHDVEVQLPETFFEGGVLKISPRSLEETGAVVKLEVLPRADTQVGEGRIFFKKIKKFISEKLIYALLAILLVIKLLAAKFMFFLPMMVGAVTAKKLLIKVLLFLFPALHHLFKLCAYVPHGAKFHHHKHHISHIHHIGRPHKHHHHGHHHGPHDSVEVIKPHAEGPPVYDEGHHWHPPSLHHSVDIEPPHKPYYNPHEQELEYYSGGPSLSHHFINHREDTSEEENEVQPWGQGQRKKPASNRPLTPTEIENMVLKAEKEAMLKARLQQEKQRIQEENARLQEQLRLAMKLQDKLKQQASMVKARLPVPPPSTHLQTPAADQKQVYSAQIKPAAVEEPKKTTSFEHALHKAASITYDPFYSPILEKIDKVLVGLGFQEEPCRERLICSMYKNPTKFSPHSNLLSAELSRDSKELQKPKSTNAAVVRFYRYVQAARDGQDKRECLRLYPACSINTEQ